MEQQPKNPTHGKKLPDILEELVSHYGWDKLAEKFQMKCF